MKRVKLTDNEGAMPLPFDGLVPSQSLPPRRSTRIDREERFFGGAPTPASRIKTNIVVSSFLGWASVMLRVSPVALSYVDLYCGRGTYKKDGSKATPLELFDRITRHPELPDVLRMLFNDSREASVFELRDRMMEHPGYYNMRFPPQFSVGEVNDDMADLLANRRPIAPTYAFIDPFGYKGLTQRLVHILLRDFGCDVMFFFSYHVIKRVIKNDNNVLRGRLDALLGHDRVQHLRELMIAHADERELEAAVLCALAESMRSIAGQAVLTFAFRRSTGYASHHLAFVSKHPRGFEVAKEAMARNSSWQYDGNIPSMEYILPGFERALLHVDAPSISKLMRLLVERRGSQLVTVDQAYESVLYDTPYYRPNVREALHCLVKNHGAALFSDGQRAELHGSKFPRNPTIRIPGWLSLP